MTQRRSLRLHREPLLVLRLFLEEARDGLLAHGAWLLRNRVFLVVVLPLAAAHLVLALAVRQALFVELHRLLLFAVWWFGLGVLSSIGLGTGMHTGSALSRSLSPLTPPLAQGCCFFSRTYCRCAWRRRPAGTWTSPPPTTCGSSRGRPPFSAATSCRPAPRCCCPRSGGRPSR